jgi:hypothetical protein
LEVPDAPITNSLRNKSSAVWIALVCQAKQTPGSSFALPIQVNFWPLNWVGRTPNSGSIAALPAIISEPSFGETL